MTEFILLSSGDIYYEDGNIIFNFNEMMYSLEYHIDLLKQKYVEVNWMDLDQWRYLTKSEVTLDKDFLMKVFNENVNYIREIIA